MHPAFSVIFFTTLAGAGQGLFTALLVGQVVELSEPDLQIGNGFYFVGGVIALVLLTAGLISSTFHLGPPSRGWRGRCGPPRATSPSASRAGWAAGRR